MINRKQQVADVALQLFAERGYDGTSTQMIAKEAMVSEALIFKHFGNKDNLLTHIIKTGYKRTIERNRGILQVEDPLQLVYNVIEMPYKFHKDDPMFWKLQSRLFNVEISQKQHEHFLQPVHSILNRAFIDLGYKEPEKETAFLMMVVEALWKIQVNKDEKSVMEMIEFIKNKYKVKKKA